MKQQPSAPVEPPLIRRNKHSVSTGNGPIGSSVDGDDATDGESVKQLLKEIRDLLKVRVHSEEEQRYEDEKENEMKKDWMLAAAVLDRICSIVFAIIFVGGTVTFMTLLSVYRLISE